MFVFFGLLLLVVVVVMVVGAILFAQREANKLQKKSLKT